MSLRLNTRVTFAAFAGSIENRNAAGAYHMFGMTPDDLSGPLCHAKSMGRISMQRVRTPCLA